MPGTTQTSAWNGQQVATQASSAEAEVPTRWVDALSTLLGWSGPRRWEDVEDALDYVLSGTPATPPDFVGGRPQESVLSGYEAAHRIVLTGLGDVPARVALRWARLWMSLQDPIAKTMVPIGGGLIEALLDDLADVFGAPSHRVPLDVAVLEVMTAQLGLPDSAVLLSAFQPGPEARDSIPSRACLTLTAMRGYDESLIRHAAVLRSHILDLDPEGQCHATRMLGRASTTTLRMYGGVIDALAQSPDPTVRASTRVLIQRRDASRPSITVEPLQSPSWARLGRLITTVPQPRHPAQL
ncbi:MAG: hypothetical protein FWD18_09875 [Micrococcales bacterium]|nr:hypothetical protein [Micrococcales bacterium]